MMEQYKSGNEFLPYHASASHTPPDFRDGWNSCFAEAEIRITELEAQLAEQKKDAQRLRELDKPDCIYTLCADDSPTPQTLESACGGAMWYLGDDGKGAYPKFCHNCQGAVIVKEST